MDRMVVLVLPVDVDNLYVLVVEISGSASADPA
jgi:hypothetical protein